MIDFKEIFFDGPIRKPTWKWRFINIAIGILAGVLLYSVIGIKNIGLVFLIVFVLDSIFFFVRAWKLKIKFNYCYFCMIWLGCALSLILFQSV